MVIFKSLIHISQEDNAMDAQMEEEMDTAAGQIEDDHQDPTEDFDMDDGKNYTQEDTRGSQKVLRQMP